MASDYQKTLELVRAWVAENPGPWDIWHLRHGIERQAPDGTADNSSTSDVFMARSLRAVGQLVDEGVLVKQGERQDAAYMTPEVQRQREADAQAASEREAKVRQDWHEAKMRLAALGLGIEHFGTSVRGIHLDLAAWHKILDRLEAGHG